MLYNNLLFFLGIYSWNYKSNNYFENVLQKKQVNLVPFIPLKNNKKLFKLSNEDSASPSLNFYINTIDFNQLTTYLKCKLYLYNAYSLIIFLFLCIQPAYLFYNICFNNNNNFYQYLITFFFFFNTHINYIWANYYFNTNYFVLFINDFILI